MLGNWDQLEAYGNCDARRFSKGDSLLSCPGQDRSCCREPGLRQPAFPLEGQYAKPRLRAKDNCTIAAGADLADHFLSIQASAQKNVAPMIALLMLVGIGLIFNNAPPQSRCSKMNAAKIPSPLIDVDRLMSTSSEITITGVRETERAAHKYCGASQLRQPAAEFSSPIGFR